MLNLIEYVEFDELETSRGAGQQACDCKYDRLWVRFSLEEMNYLIFSFLRSGMEAKRALSTATKRAISSLGF